MCFRTSLTYELYFTFIDERDLKEDMYSEFLELTRDLLDGKVDLLTFEDRMRERFTTKAYVTFTIDKLIGIIVRQVKDILSCDLKQLIVVIVSCNARSVRCAPRSR